MNDIWKKLLAFFGVSLYAIGAIGGVLASGLSGSWFVAVAVAVLAVMAFPKAKEWFNILAPKPKKAA